MEHQTSTADGMMQGTTEAGKESADGSLLVNSHAHDGDVLEAKVPENARESGSELALGSVLKISFGRLAWRLYLALVLTRLIPTIYRTTRVHYLGDLPSDSGVNIASQLSWVVDVLLEVVQEALIVPLFYMIGVTLEDAMKTENRIKTGMLFTLLIHSLFSVVFVIAASPMVKLMAQNVELLDETVMYIRLEMAAIPLNSVVQFAIVVFTLYQWRFHIYMLLVMRLVLLILFDTFFLSSFDFSLKLGVNGIAYGNIIANSIICLYSVVALLKSFPKPCLCSNMSFAWMKTWGVVGFYTGLDSLVRNVFYALAIARMVNVIGEQGTYWLANEFIWNWLLLGFLPLADVLKQDTGASTVSVIDHRLKTSSYVALTVMMAVAWLASIPLWKPFIGTVMNVPVEDVEGVFVLAALLIPAYLFHMINNLMKSVFIGKGKTNMLAIQSVMANIPVYGMSFLLYMTGTYDPSLLNITIVFASAKAVDCLVTTTLYIWYLKKVYYRI